MCLTWSASLLYCPQIFNSLEASWQQGMAEEGFLSHGGQETEHGNSEQPPLKDMHTMV